MASFINDYDLAPAPQVPARAVATRRGGDSARGAIVALLVALILAAFLWGGWQALFAAQSGPTVSAPTSLGGPGQGTTALATPSPDASPVPEVSPTPVPSPTPVDPGVAANLRLYGPGKVVVVSLAQERMVALEDGVVVRDSLVATGRPSLGGTPVGSYRVQAKFSPYRMISPWPKGSPYWYPPSNMNYALQFREDGYFLHDAPWRHAYGPGANTEALGTHGCVNVPEPAAAWLYRWAEVGTAVVVTDRAV